MYANLRNSGVPTLCVVSLDRARNAMIHTTVIICSRGTRQWRGFDQRHAFMKLLQLYSDSRHAALPGMCPSYKTLAHLHVQYVE